MSNSFATAKKEEKAKTSTFGTFLQRTKCGAIKQNPGNSASTFIFTRPDADLQEALLYLEVSHAHGIPCVDELGAEPVSHFGVADLVSHVVRKCEGHDLAWAAQQSSNSLLHGKVKDVFPSVEPLLICKEEDSLWECVKLMVQKHGHRVFLIDGNVCTGVVSPSAILSVLVEDKTALDAHQLGQSIDRWGLGRRRPVHSVNSSSSVLDAFRLMVEQRVTGLAVMQGAHVIGGVSASDVKLVLRHGGALLAKTVAELIKLERHAGVAPPRPVVLDHTHTVGALLEAFGRNKVSRVWLAERDGTISSTISYSDVMVQLLEHGFDDPSHHWGA